MKTRKPLAILAATAVASLGLTALATPASANNAVTIGGTWAGGASNITVSTNAITASTVQVTNSSNADFWLVGSTIRPAGSQDNCVQSPTPADLCKVDQGTSSTFDIDTSATDSDVEGYELAGGAGYGLFPAFTVTYADPPTPTPTPSTPTTAGPAPLIQQFEKPATGTCDEAQPEGLNWGGASSGGWGESWAQWMHEGQGGAVCTRTLAYNNSTATWQVQ